MKLLAVTNLYPLPCEPRRGMFNAQLFAALVGQGVELSTIVLVPEWRMWRWSTIRRWDAPYRRAGGGSACANRLRQGFASQEATEEKTLDVGVGDGRLPAVRYVPVFHLPVVGRNMASRFHVWALRRHRALYEACDAVLATWLYPDAVAAGVVAGECGKPFWVKVHGTDRFHMEHPGRRATIQDVAKDAAGFLPNAQFLAEYLVEHGIPEQKVHVVRHGVDRDRFHFRPREEAAAVLQKVETQILLSPAGYSGQVNADECGCEMRKTILYVGNLEHIKGPDRLLHACAHMIRRDESGPPSSNSFRQGFAGQEAPMDRDLKTEGHYDLDVVFVGNGSMRGRLEARARDLGVAGRIHFLGSRPHEEVALWMSVADCLCLPSRSEGMPNVVMEALASGCPVAATDVGDVKWLLKDGVNGYVVGNSESEVVTDLSRAIGSVLSERWDRGAIAASMKGQTWEQAAKAIVQRLKGAG
ncbi:MAG: glycosyltransferase [Lentisphaerae bacterium]|nr:glycosyltransferase [Lentisphaerota bacterium]